MLHPRLLSSALALTVLAVPVALAQPAAASALANEVVYVADADLDGNYAIVLRDLESRRVTTVLPADPVEEWIYDEPELSPDGTRIAFSTDRGSPTFDEGIAVVNRDGTGLRRLTEPPSSTNDQPYSIDLSAAWSPNGQTILFSRVTTTPNADGTATVTAALLTVPVAGGDATPVVGAGDGYTGDWSPDGSRIVFAAPAPNADTGAITVVNANGSGGRTVLGPSGYSPSWSPDGSTIAYVEVTDLDSDRVRAHDVGQIATVPATGGASTVLARTRPGPARTVAEYPSWTPDGESLVYDVFGYSTTGGFPPGELWAIDRAGVRAGKIAATPGDDAQADAHGPRPVDVSPSAASTYTPVTPRRLLDTREGLGAPKAKVGAPDTPDRGTLDLQVRGVQTAQGPVPTNATAVVLNVTVTQGTKGTDVRVYPAGTVVPGASNLNAGPGQTVPNLVTVKVGVNGAVTLRNAAGTVDLIADIAGWYTPDTAGSGFAALDPSRVLDTREGLGAPQAKLDGSGTIDLTVTGPLTTADGRTVTVPDDARAVVLNVTATGATRGTDIRAYPTSASAIPLVSNLNVRAGQTAPNLVTVAVGQGGKVTLRNGAGEVHLIADLAGYYSPGATGRFVPVTPTRFLDTRTGVGGAPIPTTAAGVADLKVVGTRGVPTAATAVVLNLTGTSTTASTDVRAYPFGVGVVPTVSNLNLPAGATRANLAIVKAGLDGRIRVRNGAGSLNLIGDLAGYMIG